MAPDTSSWPDDSLSMSGTRTTDLDEAPIPASGVRSPASPSISPHIILRIHTKDVSLVLHIPLEAVRRLSRYPLAWFCYIGYAITAERGTLERDRKEVKADVFRDTFVDDLEAGVEFAYVLPDDYNLRCIVAPYLVNPPLDDDDDCDSVSSTSMTSEVEDDVIERDDYRPHYSTAWLCLKAWHIVPLTSFNACLEHIIPRCTPRTNSSPLELTEQGKFGPNIEPEAQALKALSEYGLEHEQNGLTLTLDIHSVFDDRWIMILRTPNPYLLPSDVPLMAPGVQPLREDAVLDPSTHGQHRHTMTFQWLAYSKDVSDPRHFPSNQDAVFTQGTKALQLPNVLLLDYTYGVGVLMRWATPETRVIWEGLPQNQHELPIPRRFRSLCAEAQAQVRDRLRSLGPAQSPAPALVSAPAPSHNPALISSASIPIPSRFGPPTQERAERLAKRRANKKAQARAKRKEHKTRMSNEDAYAIMDIFRRPSEAVMAQQRALEEEEEKREREENEESVRKWLETSVVDADNTEA